MVREPESGYSKYAPPADVERARALRANAIASLRAFDQAFFSDLQAAVLDQQHQDSAWMIKLARDVDVLARGDRKGDRTLRSDELTVNLIDSLIQSNASASELRFAFQTLQPYRTGWVGALGANFSALRQAYELDDLALAHQAGPERSGAEVIADAQRQRDEADQRLGETRHSLIHLNQIILDDLCAALPQHAAAFRESYERQGFPRIFQDNSSPDALLNSALTLPDLTEAQRTELESTAAAFRPAYRALCEQMIAVCREFDQLPRHTDEGAQKREAAKYTWDQLIYERGELNISVRNALQRILRHEQLAAVGLNTPSK